MEDSGDERGEANFMADIEVLDALYLRETIESNNQKIQDVVLYWMKKYSECVLAFQDINDAVCVENTNEAIEQIKNILENMPNTTNQPPIPQILLQLPAKENGNELKRKRPAQKQVTELIEELQRSYRQIDVLPAECVPDITETMTLKDLERALNSVNDIISNIDNFHLKNAFLYGKWLDYAFDIFHLEKELGNVTFRSFEEWVQTRTKVGKRRAYSLRNLAKLGKIVPRILRCKQPVDFFVRNHRQLITYFRGNDAPEPWYHSINCTCNKCTTYFSL